MDQFERHAGGPSANLMRNPADCAAICRKAWATAFSLREQLHQEAEQGLVRAQHRGDPAFRPAREDLATGSPNGQPGRRAQDEQRLRAARWPRRRSEAPATARRHQARSAIGADVAATFAQVGQIDHAARGRPALRRPNQPRHRQDPLERVHARRPGRRPRQARSGRARRPAKFRSAADPDLRRASPSAADQQGQGRPRIADVIETVDRPETGPELAAPGKARKLFVQPGRRFKASFTGEGRRRAGVLSVAIRCLRRRTRHGEVMKVAADVHPPGTTSPGP